jgi:hypothetical protein
MTMLFRLTDCVKILSAHLAIYLVVSNDTLFSLCREIISSTYCNVQRSEKLQSLLNFLFFFFVKITGTIFLS